MIVAFSKPEDARSIRNILMKNGFQVNAVCTSGAQALALMEDLNSGVIVCGYRLADMVFSELAENLPTDFSMLMVSNPTRWPSSRPENVVCLPMPLKVHDLVESVGMLLEAQARRRRRRRQQPKERNDEQRVLLNEAKRLLMERNGMSEEEAHRYIQKTSMDSGTNMVETAQMVISLINI
jgi:response regulator NasT